MPFTVHDSAALVRRIELDLALVLSTLREADPSLRSLILTGGFARGEGTALQGRPQNDYDFVAVRGLGRTRIPYPWIRRELEKTIGLHVDLARVGAWRLPHVAPTIFWYETALRGRVLWGDNVLPRIPIRDASQLDRAEALRLLVNRAAGLLLATGFHDPDAVRIQASKALLASADAHLLSLGTYAPSQRERWDRLETLRLEGKVPREVEERAPWLEWAYRHKTDPDNAPPRSAPESWHAAAETLLEAVPTALRVAGLPSLDAYMRRDGLLDHLVYYRRAARVRGARRLILHPTGRIRVGTLRLLQASLDGHVRPEAARECLGDVARDGDQPLRLLDALRRATLQ